MGQPALHQLEPAHPQNAEEKFAEVLARAISALEASTIPYVLIGGVGSASLGRPRWTNDIDVLVTPVGIPVRNVAQSVIRQAYAVYTLEPQEQRVRDTVSA